MSDTTEAIRVCHFSDLHLVPTEAIPLRTLLSKRLLGYANLKVNRGRTHRTEHLEYLLEQVVKENADKVVVTGDFTSLALGFEFKNIDRLFRRYGLSPEKTLVIPGNHDRYTRGADAGMAFEKGLADWLPPDILKKSGYPIVIPVGPVVLIGLDTAVWRNPVRAAGAISRAQLKRLKTALSPEMLDGRWPLIAMHHPPIHRGNRALEHYRTGLAGYQRFIKTVARPATVIHGHMHVAVRNRAADLDIIGVPSASNNTGKPDTQFAYYVYTFTREGLKRVEVNRFWPDATNGAIRQERFEL